MSLYRIAPVISAIFLFCTPSFAAAARVKAPTNLSVLPLVLNGKRVPQLVGLRADQLTALSCREGRLRPVPFQVDELNARGRVVSRYGADAAVAPDETPGVIDDNDEVVVMLRDLSDACPAEELARVKGTLVSVEAAVAGWLEPSALYIAVSERGFPPKERYVDYDPANHTVLTPGYRWGAAPDNPIDFNFIGMADLPGGRDHNVFDRYKIRVRASALKSLVRLTYDETGFEATLQGVRVGPIRVVREIDGRIEVVPGYTIDAEVSIYHYDRLLTATIRFKAPQTAAMFLSSMDVSVAMDFIDLSGVRVSTSRSPEGFLVDGKMVPQEKSVAFGDEPWFMMSGKGLNWLLSLELEKGLNLTSAALFIDDKERIETPERVPGTLPTVGYELLGWEGLEARWYEISGIIAILPNFPERGGTGFFRALHAPIEVKVLSGN